MDNHSRWASVFVSDIVAFTILLAAIATLGALVVPRSTPNVAMLYRSDQAGPVVDKSGKIVRF